MINVVGIMRFSVIKSSGVGFRTTSEMSANEIAATILNPTRIAKRLEIFREIPLKSLQAQTDQDFKFIIVISSILDEKFKSELYDICSQNKFLHIEESDQSDNWRDRIFSYISPKTVSFRLDDDDAIHPGQIEKLKVIAKKVRENTVISFPNGFYVGAKPNLILFQKHRWEVNAQGIAYFCGGKRESIFDLGPHTKLKRYRMELCETPRAWMRSIHQGSDSGAGISKQAPFTSMPPKFMREFAPEYDFIDFERVHALLK